MSCRKQLILFLGVIILSSCFGNKKMKQDDIFNIVLGSDISCIDSLLNNEVPSNVFLICSVYDCGTCLEKAFAEVREIDKLIDPQSVQVIGVLADPTPLQIHFNYYNYLAYDIDDQIRRHLKFIPTPVIIVSDEDRRVYYIHRPTSSDSVSYIAKEIRELVIQRYIP